MNSLTFGRFIIEYDPGEPLPVQLFDETGEMIDWWDSLQDARMDIDYSPVGEEITSLEWEKLWDFVEKNSVTNRVPVPAGGIAERLVVDRMECQI